MNGLEIRKKLRWKIWELQKRSKKSSILSVEIHCLVEHEAFLEELDDKSDVHS